MEIRITKFDLLYIIGKVKVEIKNTRRVVLIFSQLNIVLRYLLLICLKIILLNCETKYFALEFGKEHRISVYYPLSRKIIFANASGFISAAEQFILIASDLVDRLSLKFGIRSDDLLEYSRSKNHWKGKLDDLWRYQFHGLQVSFKNIKSGQIVDVNIHNFHDKSTLLDPWFYHEFIVSTREYRGLGELITDGYSDSDRVIKFLNKDILKVLSNHCAAPLRANHRLREVALGLRQIASVTRLAKQFSFPSSLSLSTATSERLVR